MNVILEESAERYYRELLKLNKYDTEYLYFKVPILKNLMENEILKEATGISHFKNPYETGQLKWLKDNSKRFNKKGDYLSGFVPKEIISGSEYLFDERNVAEHKQETSQATYLGLFNLVTKVIYFFSKIKPPKEINDICSGNLTQESTEEINNIIDNKVTGEINKNNIKESKRNNKNMDVREKAVKNWRNKLKKGESHKAKYFIDFNGPSFENIYPSDHCYNKTNDGIKKFPYQYELLFRYNEENDNYIYEGPDAYVTGEVVFWTNRKKITTPIGKWELVNEKIEYINFGEWKKVNGKYEFIWKQEKFPNISP